MRFDDQEKYDQRTKNHKGEMGGKRGIDGYTEPVGEVIKHDGHDHNKGRAEKASHDRAEPTDDHHKK